LPPERFIPAAPALPPWRARRLPGLDSAAPGFRVEGEPYDTQCCKTGQSDLAQSHHHSLGCKQEMDNISTARSAGSQLRQAEKHQQAHAGHASSEASKLSATIPGYLLRSYEKWRQLDPDESTVFRHFPAVQAIYLMQL
jgi:hypothetical protein